MTLSNSWDLERIGIFKEEIGKMFLAYNRQVSQSLLQAKTDLLSENLGELRTDKIRDFFKGVRESEDSLPTDSKLFKLFEAQAERYSGGKRRERYSEEDITFTQEDAARCYEAGEKYPKFKEVMMELIECPGNFPTDEIHKKFIRLLGNSISRR